MFDGHSPGWVHEDTKYNQTKSLKAKKNNNQEATLLILTRGHVKRIPDLQYILLSGKQSPRSVCFFYLSGLFQSISKLFISPWCWREELIMDAKQKVTHTQYLLPQVFALQPRRESRTCPCHLTNYLKNTEDNVCFQTVIPVIIYVQYDQKPFTAKKKWLFQILKNKCSLFNLARFIMMHWTPALTNLTM